MQIPISVPTAVSKSGDDDFGQGRAPSLASRLVLAQQSLQRIIGLKNALTARCKNTHLIISGG